ncbi:DUF2524 domain-containing protein [Marinicrinis lubricantis]|uniref:DUF2524 domain-containing protein n=1 Tax=Marinicrinis lubricantis TaxID=2086470 RepID=A0ABW1IMK4_9BACL
MIENLESSYDCANASADLPQLKQELEKMKAGHDGTTLSTERINRLENQIHFIENKCLRM